MVTAMLAMSDHGAVPGFLATNTSVVTNTLAPSPIFRTDTPLNQDRWKSIVIHHSGELAGNPETIGRLHLENGARMLGYHFVIGNGNQMGNGVIHVGERWIGQMAGWHAVGPNAEFYNQHAIAICLVGNGDRRAFTDPQVDQLVDLVKRLQRELGIPASAVRLHRDVASALTSSPGRHFPTAVLDQQLLTSQR
jgi:N-acetyl-anhydromuramyl-L-alanine amidase AmpD